MGRLVYSAICSLDGYVADHDGRFDWALPSEQVVGAVNDLDEAVGTHLYGRRTYRLMTGWELEPDLADASPESGRFARHWQEIDKLVFSASLPAEEVTTSRTRLERTFDPDAVRRLVARAPADVAISGPTLAAAALRAGLVEEIALFRLPVVIGGGLPVLPPDLRLDLALPEVAEHDDGTVLMRHEVR